ncbi:hypothetical protein PFUGPA_02062 [Plasmodium falciparum Palo Alto/Uganda]|uniref:Uncharacterized protein n=1 Tax=Plasmodium falciparum (isolate Palo Alto / Uganda) TaxID=57270 RepID=W4J166_PLAFP|nr:hypothetical protein PFUGPA_02062 [Plasmodium falciparum Palo Alto/Uganda]
MSYVNKSLSTCLNFLVLHLEYVKCKNLSNYKKKGKYYMIITYDNILFYEKDFYEVCFHIFFDDILQIYTCDVSNYIHITLKDQAVTNNIGIKGMNKNVLIKQLSIAYSTFYMFQLNKNVYVPLTNETYEERSFRTGHFEKPKIDTSIQPFIGYKKVVFDDYFFFIRKSFQNFISISCESNFYVDYRGIEISIKIDDQKNILEIEQSPDNNFFQLCRNHINFLTTIDSIVNFFLHLREKDYSNRYELNCLDLLKEDASNDIEIGKLLDSNKYYINDFFLFYLHQCGYVNKYYYYKDDNNYKKIISYILKYGMNFEIKKKICKNLLIFSNDYKNKYIPLVNSMICFLSFNYYEKNFCLFILSTLINITNNNDELKNRLIELNISTLCNFLILLNDIDITNKIILLYINLCKEQYMCEDFINKGLLIHFLDILFRYYYIDLYIKKQMCINILCIIGHIFNCKKYYIFILNYYNGLLQLAIYIYQTTDFIQFDKLKLIFFFKQISQHSYIIKDKICKHIVPLVIKEIYLYINKDFIYSSLHLINTLTDYKNNCLYLQKVKIFYLFNFIKQLKILDLYQKVEQLENKLKKILNMI